MDILIVVLLIALLALVGAAVYFMFMKKENAVQPTGDTLVSGASVISARNAAGNGRRLIATFEIDMDEIIGNEPAPMSLELEREVAVEQTDLEKLRDMSIPEEERAAIAESLRMRGYDVRILPSGSTGSRHEAPQDGAGDEDEDGMDAENDEGVLEAILANPYASAERKEAAKRRLEELRGGKEADDPDDDEDGGGDDGDGGEGGNGGYEDGAYEGYVPDDEYYGGCYVDPLDGMGLDDPHPETPYEPPVEKASEAEASGAAAEEAGAADGGAASEPSDAPAEEAEAGEVDIEFTFKEEYDDEEDSRKAVSLMTFIARSFKKDLISPELVAFAQDLLHLQVNRGYWSEEKWIRANQRKAVYERDASIVNMSIDEFDLYVKDVVASNEASLSGAAEAVPGEEGAVREEPVDKPEPEEAALEAVPEGEVKEEKARPQRVARPAAPRGKGFSRPVSSFFDAHGGKNDLMWQRLEHN